MHFQDIEKLKVPELPLQDQKLLLYRYKLKEENERAKLREQFTDLAQSKKISWK